MKTDATRMMSMSSVMPMAARIAVVVRTDGRDDHVLNIHNSVHVIYTVARAREGVGRTWGITVKDAPGAAGGCVMPGVRRTSGRPRAGDSPRCAAPRAGEPLEPSPGIPLWASDYPADMKVRGVAWVWCSAERVLW